MIISEKSNLQLAIGMFFPSIFTTFGVSLIDKPVFYFFIEAFSKMVDYRQREKIVRNYVMNLLIKVIEKGHVDDANKNCFDQFNIKV